MEISTVKQTSIIGTSFYAAKNRFSNYIGITSDIPKNSQIPPERHCPALGLPYSLKERIEQGGYPMEAMEEAYRAYLKHSILDIGGFIDELISRWGPGIVFLGLRKNPLECHRSILAKVIQEETSYEVREVREQADLYSIDFDSILEKYKPALHKG